MRPPVSTRPVLEFAIGRERFGSHSGALKIGIELAASITPDAIGWEVVRNEWSASVSAARYLALYREVATKRPGFRR